MNHKILLINTPRTALGNMKPPPLGLLYLAGMLLKHNVDVRMIDGCVEKKGVVEKTIREYKPTIVGISCFTSGRKISLKVARLVKKIDESILVVMGGMHVTHMYQQVLENYPYVDICVRGEGEKTFLEIVQGKNLFKIDGVAFRDGKEIIVTKNREYSKNLDEIPFPAWHLVDFKKYCVGRGKIRKGNILNKATKVNVIFSRGCMGRCNFCSIWWVWGNYRNRSAKNMADEIELLYKKFNINHFEFTDDALTLNKKEIIKLCNEIISRELHVSFMAITRADFVDEEVLIALKKAGCYRISFGVESGDPAILKDMNKAIGSDNLKNAFALSRKVGIESLALIINGYFGETVKSINRTIDFLKEINPDRIGTRPGLFVYPGTNDYERCKKMGFINDNFWLGNRYLIRYTKEHNRLTLNSFSIALFRRQKMSKYKIVNYFRFLPIYYRGRIAAYFPEPIRIIYHQTKVKLKELWKYPIFRGETK